jgi:hypothetical protein
MASGRLSWSGPFSKIRLSTVYPWGSVWLPQPETDMTTTQSYERKYGHIIAAIVLSSKAKVAAAGRWGDQARIEAERTRHYQLMASLP